jgi:hypothetical protein
MRMRPGSTRSRTTTPLPTFSEHRFAFLAGAALHRFGVNFFGIVGPLLVCAGLALAWLPLGVIMLGLVLWALDWRKP